VAKKVQAIASILVASTVLMFNPPSVSAGSILEKQTNNVVTLGYLDTEPFGYYGNLTVKTVRELQKTNELVLSKIKSNDTYAINHISLRNSTTSRSSDVDRSSKAQEVIEVTLMKEGVEGDAVKQLQRDLKSLGYFKVEPTGHYGKLTAQAVKDFQYKKGLSVDGVAGENTLKVIDRLLRSTTNKASDGTCVFKEKAEGTAVKELQADLKKLGFFKTEPTGHYGPLTAAAIKELQKKYGLSADGIAGRETITVINNLLNGKKVAVKSSASPKTQGSQKPQKTNNSNSEYKLSWDKAQRILKRGGSAKIYDIGTGLSFNIKRTYGTNHADCEPLTKEDTAIMKKIYGGSWSWARRAVIVTVGDTHIAASMAGMPHAGSDKYAANKTISSRSGGYGRGTNLDAVKGNDMNGHFDLHFYKSKTHASNRVDSKHQSQVNRATEWAKKNL
jgi:peptidoglycan hydrolase-like protein with peptidoglycan-binding domain